MVVNPDEILDLLLALPEEKQKQAKAYIEKLIREWDPDFVKLTPREKRELDEIRKNPEYTKAEDIDWDNLDKY